MAGTVSLCLQDRTLAKLDAAVERCAAEDRAKGLTGREVTFSHDAPFQDGCSLCLIQIGEAVNRLSDDFKMQHPEIDWKRIYGMRCHLVHGYEMFDAEIVWDAIEHHLPPLREFCVTHSRPEPGSGSDATGGNFDEGDVSRETSVRYTGSGRTAPGSPTMTRMS